MSEWETPIRVGDIVRNSYGYCDYEVRRITVRDNPHPVHNYDHCPCGRLYSFVVRAPGDFENSYLNNYAYRDGRYLGNYPFPPGTSGYRGNCSEPDELGKKRNELFLVRRADGVRLEKRGQAAMVLEFV